MINYAPQWRETPPLSSRPTALRLSEQTTGHAHSARSAKQSEHGMDTQFARLTLEVGGTTKSSTPTELPPSCLIVDTRKLPNPYNCINRNTLEASAPAIIDWMSIKSPQTDSLIQQMVERAKGAFGAQRSVRVQCYGGKHRSQAVAWKILEALDQSVTEHVDVVCLDGEPLPELAPYVRANI